MKKILLPFFSLFLLILNQSLAQDKFAEIGTQKYETREHLLTVPQPLALPNISLPVSHNPESVFKKKKAIDSKEELLAELEKLKEEYHPFMQNLAPTTEETRLRIPLDEFDWRVETEADRSDFTSTLNGGGQWEKVSIPHYGPPLGRAVTYYFKEINLSAEAFSKGSLFIRFKGVDYNNTSVKT